jgi:uncharacterized protein (TIGR00288 family)
MSETHSLAVFVDFENLALGFEGRRGTRFEIQKVLERLVEKGKIIVKRAYADWGRFREYRTSLHEAAIELIEIPRRSMTGKNSADIRLVVDAMDLSYSKEHVDTFVIISGDSDFSPLVSKLKENGKHVIGLGMKNSTSDLLIENCDEFIFYEDLDRVSEAPQPSEMTNVPAEKRKVFTLVMDAFVALRRENKEVIWSSMVKDTIKRKKPQFNESYYGYRSFSNLLEDAQKFGVLSLTTDSRSGTYVVSEAGSRGTIPAPSPATNGGAQERRRDENNRDKEDRWGRRRGRFGRGRWEERRGGAPGSESRESPETAGQAAEAAPAYSEQDFESTPETAPTGGGFEAPLESGMAAEPSMAASSDRELRDDYGFPGPDSPVEPESLPEALDLPVHHDDDRTPEEREMDARAAAMAHSRQSTTSPSVEKKTVRGRGTGVRRPRAKTATGAVPGRRKPSGGTGAGAPGPRPRRPAGARRVRKSD